MSGPTHLRALNACIDHLVSRGGFSSRFALSRAAGFGPSFLSAFRFDGQLELSGRCASINLSSAQRLCRAAGVPFSEFAAMLERLEDGDPKGRVRDHQTSNHHVPGSSRSWP